MTLEEFARRAIFTPGPSMGVTPEEFKWLIDNAMPQQRNPSDNLPEPTECTFHGKTLFIRGEHVEFVLESGLAETTWPTYGGITRGSGPVQNWTGVKESYYSETWEGWDD